jgi:hypothetical protein
MATIAISALSKVMSKIAGKVHLGGKLFFSLNLFALKNLFHVIKFSGIDTAIITGPPT